MRNTLKLWYDQRYDQIIHLQGWFLAHCLFSLLIATMAKLQSLNSHTDASQLEPVVHDKCEVICFYL